MEQLIQQFIDQPYYPVQLQEKIVFTFFRIVESYKKPLNESEESNMVWHARRELEAAGLKDKDSDYGGMLFDAVMDLVKLFSSQGHSGCSANMALQIFDTVCRFKNLTPITDNPEDWMQVSERMPDREPTWQCRRCSSCFSHDAGKTYYNIDDWIVHDETGSYYKSPTTQKMYTSESHKERLERLNAK